MTGEPAAVDPAVVAHLRSLGKDPALLRWELLSQMDALIDANATHAHVEARRILEDVYPLPYLGVDADPAEGGMRITVVYPSTGAAAAGLRAGDVLLSIDGLPTTAKANFGPAVRRQEPGRTVDLLIRREGRELVLPCTLGRRPAEDEDEEEQFPELFGTPPAVPPPVALDFEGAELGGVPAGLEPVLAGYGGPARWEVIASDGGRALRQASSDPTSLRFPMLLLDGEWSDAVARVRFRLAGGDVDRAGGIVMRYRDAGNYLVARANAAEGDLRIFRVVNGVRRTLPGAVLPLPIDDTAWHVLELRAVGPKLSASIDGGAPITSYDTYLRRGRVGLWTKADAVTEFDDLDVRTP